MAIRTINISVSFDMSNIPSGAVITPKETVKEMVTNEMMEVFGNDEGFFDLQVDVVDEGFKVSPMDYVRSSKRLATVNNPIRSDYFEF